jgi:hypothetical protein
MPGNYTVRLTVDGVVRTQSLTVRMDPRVRTPLATLRQQHDLSLRLYDAIFEARRLMAEARTKGLTEFVGREGFGGIEASHLAVIDVLQGSDAPPTAAAVSAANERLAAWDALVARWRRAAP